MTDHVPNMISVLGDSPVQGPDLDHLQFRRYSDILAGLISNPKTETPFTVGVYGKWGTGKTTLLHQIEDQLDRKKFHTVWFNPWLFHNEENLIVPLLHTIHDSLRDSAGQKVLTSIERIATVVSQVSASVILKTLTLDNVSLEDIENRIALYNKKKMESVSAVHRLRKQLQEAVDEITDQGRSGRLVIFIDDLDRCIPTVVVRVLESVRLFLDLKHTIIFMAIDKEIVQQGIRVTYKDLGFQEDIFGSLTSDYLDKVIQLPFVLHPLQPATVGRYLEKLGLPPSVVEQLELFQSCLQPNPRKIKRIINLFALNVSLFDGSDPDMNSDRTSRQLLAKIILIQQQWPTLYQDIVQLPDLLDVLEKVYLGKLSLHKKSDWVYLDSKQDALWKLCEKHYQPESQLASLFQLGAGFAGVNPARFFSIMG